MSSSLKLTLASAAIIVALVVVVMVYIRSNGSSGTVVDQPRQMKPSARAHKTG